MTQPATPLVVRTAIKSILGRRRDVLRLASRQRSKFEGWLKFEIAAELALQIGAENIRLEESYPDVNDRCDLTAKGADGKWYIELKTPNTNWRSAGLENLGRPITRNIDGIIYDLTKIRARCQPDRGLIAFVMFPVPRQVWLEDRQQIRPHLNRIESECDLRQDVVEHAADYIEIAPNYGCILVVLEVSAVKPTGEDTQFVAGDTIL